MPKTSNALPAKIDELARAVSHLLSQSGVQVQTLVPQFFVFYQRLKPVRRHTTLHLLQIRAERQLLTSSQKHFENNAVPYELFREFSVVPAWTKAISVRPDSRLWIEHNRLEQCVPFRPSKNQTMLLSV